MNSGMSPLKDKSLYVWEIVRQCSLLPQLVDLRRVRSRLGTEEAVEPRSHPCFQTWVTLGPQVEEKLVLWFELNLLC